MDTDYHLKAQNAEEPDDPHPLVQDAMRAGHETTDVNVTGLLVFLVGLLMTVTAILIGLVIFFKVFSLVNTLLTERIANSEPGAASKVRLAPDYHGPLLQVKPEDDLRGMRLHDDAELNNYGWVDRPAGIVRIPIDRAMDLLVERGLPPVSQHHTLEELQRMRAQPQLYGQSLRP